MKFLDKYIWAKLIGFAMLSLAALLVALDIATLALILVVAPMSLVLIFAKEYISFYNRHNKTFDELEEEWES